MPGGRPTKYSKDMVALAIAYIDNYETEYEHIMPSIIGLAMIMDVVSSTLYNWGDEHPEFLGILGKIKEKQEYVLLSKGLQSEFNSNITKLALGKHGYHDKVDNNTAMSVHIDKDDAGLL